MNGSRARALVEARHVWLMGRQWGVLFEVAASSSSELVALEAPTYQADAVVEGEALWQLA